ncbi:hypothetical protein [Streptomyces sp. NPDC000851]
MRTIAGPENFSVDELGRITLSRKGDNRTVVTAPPPPPAGSPSSEVSVLTDKDAHLTPTRYADRLS